MMWPLLAPLPGAAQEAVLAVARRRTFGKGEVLFHEGDPADALHLLVSGHLAVQVSTIDGERATLNVLGPGSHVGELALLPGHGSQPRSATVLALDPVETRVLSGAAFHEVCRQNSPVHVLLENLLAERVRELSAQLIEAMYVGLDRRLYRCLLRLAEVYGNGTDCTVIPLTQDQLSDLVGGTRPSVNQVLQRLVAQGLIELGRGRLTLLDPVTLRRKAGA